MGWKDAKVKLMRKQKEFYESEEKYLTRKKYEQFIIVANQIGKKRLSLIVQTIGSIGIRVSELRFITVESLKKGKVYICNKGSMRIIF